MTRKHSDRAIAIERQSEEVVRAANALGSPVDLEKICQSLDVNVHYEDLEDKVSGVLMIKDGHRHAIINRHHHPNRQRFSLAHELGHLVLHDSRADRLFIDMNMRVYQRVGAPSDDAYAHGDSLTSQIEEKEANLFASSLLMPADLLKSEALHLDLEEELDVALLARTFSVSDQAMTIRLQQLGLLRIAFI